MSGKKSMVTLGIDLGGTAVKIGIVNEAYEVLAQTTIPTEAERGYEPVIADMGRAGAALLEENGFGIGDCLGVGVGSPGTVDSKNGVVLYSNNIRWDHVPLSEELKKYLPLPVFINNDANCAALGEVVRGAARGCRNAVFLTLGTGVGGGIVLDGKIFEGGNAGGAELGHIKNGSEGRGCTCGRTDCLECYASATALVEDAKNMAALCPDSALWELCGGNLDSMTAKMAFDAADAGDHCGGVLVDNYIRHLADGIVDLANIFRPDMVVLGGGVCAQGEKLTKPLNEALQKYCFGASVAPVPQVVIAQNGNSAGVIGAASLVLAQKFRIERTKAPELLFLEPACTENIWGGSRLKEEFHYAAAADCTGECWGISAHPAGDGMVRSGELAGQRLSRVWREHPELFGRRQGGDFPLLVKMIDAREDLSIQVHPDDRYAGEHEDGASGKTECWYVMDCGESASLVIGHNARTKEELAEMVAEGRWGELIREVPIQKGDFIQIDPGTVHAIRGGCLILETQQNSDVTYRLYDYGRLSNGVPRELHIQKSLDVIRVPAAAASDCVKHTKGLPANSLNRLYGCAYYEVFLLEVDGAFELEQTYQFLLMSVIAGEGYADRCPLNRGDHFIVPDRYGRLRLEGKMRLIVSTEGERRR